MLVKKNKIPIKQIILIGFLPSFLKKVIYRLKGYKIGKKVSFGIGSVILGKEVTIKDGASFGFLSVVRATHIQIDRFVRIGALSMIDTEKVIIGEDARINENVIVGGIKTPESMLKVGKRAIIMEYSFINPTKPIIIGDDSGIGGHCLLFTHGSWLNELDGFPVTFAPITLGNKVWLPWRVFIMPGVEIGDEVVIGANSLISKNLPSNVLAAGSPAKVISENYPSPISEEKRKLIFERILNEFIEHLNFNGFEVKTIENDDRKTFKITKGKMNSEMAVSMNGQGYSFKTADSLLVMFKGESPDRTSNTMILNIESKTRLNSSLVGEEYTKFLSRYGIRFDRLD